MIVWLVRAAVAEPAIAAELLRLATSAVAEVTGLGGGGVSVGAEADFVVLESNRQRQSVTTEAAYEPLALSSINFGSDGDGKRTRPSRRTVYRGGRQVLFAQERAASKL